MIVVRKDHTTERRVRQEEESLVNLFKLSPAEPSMRRAHEVNNTMPTDTLALCISGLATAMEWIMFDLLSSKMMTHKSYRL